MPWDVLVKGPWNGGIDNGTRQVIDLEIEKRFRSIHPMVANVIATAALIVSIIALFRSGS
jgi:hypothetical protein